jgi:hypothetical protein
MTLCRCSLGYHWRPCASAPPIGAATPAPSRFARGLGAVGWADVDHLSWASDSSLSRRARSSSERRPSRSGSDALPVASPRRLHRLSRCCRAAGYFPRPGTCGCFRTRRLHRRSRCCRAAGYFPRPGTCGCFRTRRRSDGRSDGRRWPRHGGGRCGCSGVLPRLAVARPASVVHGRAVRGRYSVPDRGAEHVPAALRGGGEPRRGRGAGGGGRNDHDGCGGQ